MGSRAVNDLVAFLNARLDEDEEQARRVQAVLDDGWNYFDETPTELIDPARALREVEVKRAIVRRCAIRMNEMDQHPNGLVSPRALLARQVLMDLAAVWSDHPDYRAEWKPC